MEEKFIACYEAITQATWLSNFVSGFNVSNSISKLVKIYCYNAVAVFFFKNNKSGSRNKHIVIKYLIVREEVKENKVFNEHISIELMIVDPVTKALWAKQYRDHVDRMCLAISFDV